MLRASQQRTSGVEMAAALVQFGAALLLLGVFGGGAAGEAVEEEIRMVVRICW